MSKYITFTFDDGLINTAKKVETLNIHATFYIVLGWVFKTIQVTDSFNLSQNHGSIKDWKNLNVDIGCHTYYHEKKFDEKFCYEQFSSNFKGFKNLATPYGIDYSPEFYHSCKIGFFNNCYNYITAKNIKKIYSINPKYDFTNKKTLESNIINCPNEAWIVFTFHGIDEGWNPIDLQELKFWIKFFTKRNFTFISVSQAVEKTCKKYLL